MLGKGLNNQGAHCLPRLYRMVSSDFNKMALETTLRKRNVLQVVPDIKMGPNVRRRFCVINKCCPGRPAMCPQIGVKKRDGASAKRREVSRDTSLHANSPSHCAAFSGEVAPGSSGPSGMPASWVAVEKFLVQFPS